MRKISIVTAFHDLLPYNEVFWEMLERYTCYPFELIAVNNASSDGSGDFFESIGATVLRQPLNLNYSKAMNIGTNDAAGDFICHINNDVIVSPNWDRILIEAMEEYSLDFVSPASMELMPKYTDTKKILRNWKKIGRPNISAPKEEIIKKWKKMYVDWDEYCSGFETRNKGKLLDAINGHTVMIRRSAWQKMGCYDEKMLATDWDLYLRAKKREAVTGDIVAPKVVLWAYVHHFMGTTAGLTKCAYDHEENSRNNITDKWPIEELDKYWPFPMHLYPAPKFRETPFAYLRYAFKRLFNLYEWGDKW